jgi:hypothetical protein
MVNLEEKVPIELSKGELLVIFEFLARSYQQWKASGDQQEATFVLAKPDNGERTALWRLEGSIERTMVEVFAPDYSELIRNAKNNLASE